jgi:ubiquinone/menaquinone biosynthesis C-methylase UbiE
VRRPDFIARQSACPSGLLGRLIGRVMAHETAEVNEVALGLLELQPDDRVLEIGFGHGATLARAAAAVSRGFVAGVDPSIEMCRMAARLNRRAVERGTIELHRAAVEALPFPDGAFGKVLAVHTLYFWPDLARCLREIVRVMQPDGRLVLAYRNDAQATREFPASVYRFRGDNEVREALRGAGLGRAELVHRTTGRARTSFFVARRDRDGAHPDAALGRAAVAA